MTEESPSTTAPSSLQVVSKERQKSNSIVNSPFLLSSPIVDPYLNHLLSSPNFPHKQLESLFQSAFHHHQLVSLSPTYLFLSPNEVSHVEECIRILSTQLLSLQRRQESTIQKGGEGTKERKEERDTQKERKENVQQQKEHRLLFTIETRFLLGFCRFFIGQETLAIMELELVRDTLYKKRSSLVVEEGKVGNGSTEEFDEKEKIRTLTIRTLGGLEMANDHLGRSTESSKYKRWRLQTIKRLEV